MKNLQKGIHKLLLLGLLMPVTGMAQVLYSSMPEPLPGSLPSLGYQATQTAEFGDHISFDGASSTVGKIDVTMNSWACQESNWTADCANPDAENTGYIHPITLNIYEVDNATTPPSVGALITTVTEDFLVPWRPAKDVECDEINKGGYLPDCDNGYNFVISYDFGEAGIELPEEIIFGVAFNTQTWGANPIGVDGPYTSLNFSVSEGATVGLDVDPDMVFWNTMSAGYYTDGGAAGVGVFRADTNWAEYVPAVRFYGPAIGYEPIPANSTPALALLVMLMLAGGWYFRGTMVRG